MLTLPALIPKMSINLLVAASTPRFKPLLCHLLEYMI